MNISKIQRCFSSKIPVVRRADVPLEGLTRKKCLHLPTMARHLHERASKEKKIQLSTDPAEKPVIVFPPFHGLESHRYFLKARFKDVHYWQIASFYSIAKSISLLSGVSYRLRSVQVLNKRPSSKGADVQRSANWDPVKRLEIDRCVITSITE